MSKISETNLLQPAIPGTISIMSRQNTVHNPSLVQDIWEFDHDPDDQFIKKIIRDKQAKLRKQHSHQQLQKRLPMYPNDGSSVNHEKYRYHSQVTMQMQKNEYGLAGNKPSGFYLANNNHQGSKKSLSRSRSNGSHTHTGRQLQRMSKSNQSKDSLQHIRNIQKIAQSLPGFEESNIVPRQHYFEEDNFQQSRRNINRNQQIFLSPTRNLDIYSHKYISNLNYMLTQIKQLLTWNKIHRYQAQIEESRKSIMKLQIECRKLKIGLRSSVSVGGLFKLRRKEYIGGFGQNDETRNLNAESREPRELKNQIQREYHHGNNMKKKSVLKPTWGSRPSKTSRKSRMSKIQSQKEKVLNDQILHQKKKYQQLGTRESLITNYYNVLKNKLLSEIATDNTLNDDPAQISLGIIPNSMLPSQSKIITPKGLKHDKHDVSISQNIIPSMKVCSKNSEEIQILLRRKKILKASITQSKQHYQTKINQLSEEIGIMKKQFQIIQNKLYGHRASRNYGKQDSESVSQRTYYQQSRPQELYYNNNMGNKKSGGQYRKNFKNFSNSNSQKKFVFRSSSKEDLNNVPHRFGQNHNNSKPKNQNWKINKVKSSKDFYPNFHERGRENEQKKGNISGKKEKSNRDQHYFNEHNQYYISQKIIESNSPK